MTEFIENFIAQLSLISIVDVVDVFVVAYLVFQAMKLVRETRALQLIKGLLALVGIYLVAYVFQLKTVTFIMINIVQIGALALLVVFQPELRRALEQMGRTRFSGLSLFGGTQIDNDLQRKQWEQTITAVCDACATMSRQKTGALIIFERQTPLGDVIRTGTMIDAQPSYELVGNLFFHNSPLHDGAVVVRDGKIFAAGCFLPLSDNFTISRELGTRHRAALGMSENSDALCVVVSEETGKITTAENGKLKRGLTLDELRSELTNALIIDRQNEIQKKKGFLGGKKQSTANKEVKGEDEEV